MLSRFARFNVVGAIGFVLQVALLTLLVRAGVPVVAATLVAVEAAVLHNFAWHERWTWGRRGALGRFHLTNGAISLAGNIVVTPLLISEGVPLLAANLSAVIACALINFLAAQLVVFREAGREEAEGAETSLTQGPLRGRDRGARAGRPRFARPGAASLPDRKHRSFA